MPSKIKQYRAGFAFAVISLAAGTEARGGTLYVSNFGDNTISAVDSSGNVTTFVSSGAGLSDPLGLGFDSAGDLLVANLLNKNSSNGIVAVAPNGTVSPYAYLNDFPAGITLDSSGNVWVANVYGDTVSEVTGPFPTSGSGNITAIGPDSDLLNLPQALAFNQAGTLFVVSQNYGGIAEINSGVVSSFVTSALFNGPDGIAIDGDGNIYVANGGGSTILEVTPEGVVSVYATGLDNPGGLAFDSSGDLFVADSGSNSIKEVAPGGGMASVFATGLDDPAYLAFNTTESAAPEPASMALAGLGCLALTISAGIGRRPAR